MITLKELTNIEELEQLEIIEQNVWGMESLPVHQTLTAVKNGGIIVGAFDNNRIIGFSYGFAGFKDDQVYLCSHMLGIETEYRSKKIGEQLKKKQLEIAQQKGYTEIHWTYDPLETRNGYLKLSKLNGISSVYMENAYGEMKDGLNKGLPSDRFEVHWHITSDHVKNPPVYDNLIFLNSVSNHSQVPVCSQLDDTSLTEAVYAVEVPKDFQRIKNEDKNAALDWRMKTRELFNKLFESGYAAIQLIPGKYTAHYIFVKKDTLKLGGNQK